MSQYEVRWTEAGRAPWREISDARLRAKLLTLAGGLADEPALKGKRLKDDLDGYLSLPWSRWRLIYSIDEDAMRVWVFVVGQRAEGNPGDVYRTASKFLRLGLLTPPSEEE
jgi:mRNA-degrading endonuclease RelE of RelBE toxin-antitoxin system